MINYSKEPKEHENYRKSAVLQAQSLLLNKSKLRLQPHKVSPIKEAAH